MVEYLKKELSGWVRSLVLGLTIIGSTWGIFTNKVDTLVKELKERGKTVIEKVEKGSDTLKERGNGIIDKIKDEIEKI